MATINIQRSTDRIVLDVLLDITRAFNIPNAQIQLQGDGGYFSVTAPPEQVLTDENLKHALAQNGYLISYFYLTGGGRSHRLISVTRPDNSVVDHLVCSWSNDPQIVTPSVFGEITTKARVGLREIRVDEQSAALGVPNFDELVKSRSAELNRLQEIAASIVAKSHQQSLENEAKYSERRTVLENEYAGLRTAGQQDIEQQKVRAEDVLKARADALENREKEVYKSESKYARRQLRLDLLKILAAHSDRFRLSSETRRLRWPILLLLTIALGGSGYLTYLAFEDLTKTITQANAEWWRVAMVSAKQVVFFATFLGLAAYAFRWQESWARRHADAEFYFKQLELDINRASWVVEIAAEWREKEGAELPKELLAQLSNHLFAEPGSSSELSSGDSPLASILGGATKLKLATPGGGELEISRSGIRRLMK